MTDHELDAAVQGVIASAETLIGVYLKRYEGRVPDHIRGFCARKDTAFQLIRVAATALATHVEDHGSLSLVLNALNNLALQNVRVVPVAGALHVQPAQTLTTPTVVQAMPIDSLPLTQSPPPGSGGKPPSNLN